VSGFPGMTVTFTPDMGYSNATGTSNVATVSIIVGPPPATIFLNPSVGPPVIVSGTTATNPQVVAVGEQLSGRFRTVGLTNASRRGLGRNRQ
jgi:hypothetical protein